VPVHAESRGTELLGVPVHAESRAGPAP